VATAAFAISSLRSTARPVSCCVPVVFLVTSVAAARPLPLPPKLLKAVVCLLLVASGAGMIGAALSAISRVSANY
jgi:hypothetical protein